MAAATNAPGELVHPRECVGKMLMPSAHTRPVLLVHKVNYEPFAPAVPDLLRLRGGIDAAVWSDLTISILVLLGVAFAARSGSSLMAAVFSKAVRPGSGSSPA